MDETRKENLSNRNIWTRGLYTVFFTIAYTIAETLVALTAIAQFVLALVTGRTNDALLKLGAGLSVYLYQVVQFVTFNDERLPFPFSDWPDEQPGTKSPWTQAPGPDPDPSGDDQGATINAGEQPRYSDATEPQSSVDPEAPEDSTPQRPQ